jgi:mono/diheme cytochrome c family protein
LLRWKRSQTADYLVELVAADGYRATAPLALLLQHENEGLVAFRDAVRPRAHPWATFAAGKQRITPAPFYLVWTRRDRRLPWPYQLTEIRLVESAAAFAAAVPRDPSALGGFELFRANCIACHSINLVGGAVGPELNVPRNVLEYWPPELFASYVRNPASFRFRARMPSFEALSGDELRAIERYLAAMKDQKICDSIDACERAAGQ